MCSPAPRVIVELSVDVITTSEEDESLLCGDATGNPEATENVLRRRTDWKRMTAAAAVRDREAIAYGV